MIARTLPILPRPNRLHRVLNNEAFDKMLTPSLALSTYDTNMAITVGQNCASIARACSAFLTETLALGQSFYVKKGDTQRYRVVCCIKGPCFFQWVVGKVVDFPNRPLLGVGLDGLVFST